MDTMLKNLRKYKYILIIIIVFIFYNSFFINKAIHIDDPFTIFSAKSVSASFFRPLASGFFLGNPPFLGYYYAPIIKVFGEKEAWLHIFYLPFSLLAIVSMYFLCLRFSKKDLLPMLSLICTPAFIISSQNIMLDIPLLGFFLAGIVLFIYGIDRNNNFLLILSGLVTGLAILTKYSGLMLIPILFIYALVNSDRKKIKFLIIPVFIFFLWSIYCIFYFKNITFVAYFVDRFMVYFLNRIGIRILASLSFLSGASIVILFLVPFLLQKKKGLFCFSLSLICGTLPFIIRHIFYGYSLFEKCFLSILFIASSYIILLILMSGFRSLLNKNNKDTFFLSFWFFLMFIFNILTNFIAARFILLLLPPLFLFIYNELDPYALKAVKSKVKFVILISIIFSTVLAVGDYKFAGLYRHFVGSFKKIVPLEEKENIYFYHGSYYYSWGYAYYLEKFDYVTGLDYEVKERSDQRYSLLVTPTEPVLPIAIGEGGIFDNFIDLDYGKTLIDSVCYEGNIFLHNRKHHVGFYSHDWGLLPFYLSMRKAPFERFDIYRLSVL